MATLAHMVPSFEDELEKIAELSAGKLIFGGGALLAGGLTAYDVFKSRGLLEHQKNVHRALRSKRGVDVRSYVRRRDPKVQVLDNKEKIHTVFDKEFADHPTKEGLKIVATDMVKKGNNAAALSGLHGDYIICRGRLPPEIIEHELGHLKDYREKGLNFKKQGPYKHSIAQIFFRTAYDKSAMAAEKAAWAYVPDSTHKTETEQHALGTYDKSFHVRRAVLMAPVAYALLMSALTHR